MPLIDLKTNLKDLRFGHDQFGSGNSGQPFVVTTIPATNEPLQTSFSVGPDATFIIGSTIAAAGASAGIFALGAAAGGVGIGTAALIGTGVGLGIGLAGNIDQGNNLNFKYPTAGTGGNDFLLRGGTLVANYIFDDVNRLTKFFKSTGGILFTAKQNLLSRISVRTQASPSLLNNGIYTPLSALIEAAGLPFGIHVNKQGLNPFELTGPDSTSERLYGVKVKNTQPQSVNRLVNLYVVKIGGKGTTSEIFSKEDNNKLTIKNNNISLDNLILFDYPGGPGSALGLGKTKIKLSNPTWNENSDTQVSSPQTNFLVYSQDELNTQVTLASGDLFSAIVNTPTNPSETNGGIDIEGVEVTQNQFDISNWRYTKGYTPALYVRDFRTLLYGAIARYKDTSPTFQNTLISKAPPYYTIEDIGGNIEDRVGLGDPGNSTMKDISSYVNGYSGDVKTSFGAASPKSFDKINALPIYTPSSKDPSKQPTKYIDLVDFRIGVLNTSNPGNFEERRYLHFRAFLDQISDNYTSDWDSIKYIGRGEKFYTYSGFDRKISLSWTVAAQSKIELIPMYKKLNYLASLCAPDYSSQGYMRGNIITLTIGGYLYEQTGIITGLSYEMNDDNATWEIGIDDESGYADTSVKQLPHLIKVRGFEFTPIHNFIPRKQTTLVRDTGEIVGYGAQKFISLFDGKEQFNQIDALTDSYATLSENGAPKNTEFKQDIILSKYKNLSTPTPS